MSIIAIFIGYQATSSGGVFVIGFLGSTLLFLLVIWTVKLARQP